MAGYFGFSMSNNARAAYADGSRPMSKWTKADLIAELPRELRTAAEKVTADRLRRELLRPDGWHHTSIYYNKTPFFCVDADAIEQLDLITLQKWIKEEAEERARGRRERASTPPPRTVYITAKANYTVWTGTRAHPRPVQIRGEEVHFIKGARMVKTKNGNKRLDSLELFDVCESEREA